jgi:predicted outer membrane lipoprotein
MIALILGILAAAFGLLGAYLAAHALDVGMYTFGFGLMAFGVFYPLWLVKMHFDDQERTRLSAASIRHPE